MLDKIKYTATFLHGFTNPEEYKILTHGFDPKYPDDFYYYVNRLRQDLILMKGLIPDTLYDLLFGFLFGPSWIDADGEEHLNHCASDEWFNWCKSNPGKHPKDCFVKDFKAFKNSFRIYAPDFEDYIEGLANDNRIQSLNITQEGLDSFDSYLDVRRLRYVIDKILNLMSEEKHSSYKDVRFSLLPRIKMDGFVIDTISIEQIGSFASKTLDDVMSHFEDGGGDLATIKNSMQDYFGWSIESKWRGVAQRWNIIRDNSILEREQLPATDVTGFRHLIKVYHKA